MQVRIEDYRPMKFEGNYVFSFTILPELSIYWHNGLQNIYLSWLFWELNIMIHPYEKNSNT